MTSGPHFLFYIAREMWSIIIYFKSVFWVIFYKFIELTLDGPHSPSDSVPYSKGLPEYVHVISVLPSP